MIRERLLSLTGPISVMTITEGACDELIFHIPSCELAETGKPYNEDIDSNRKQVLCNCIRQRLRETFLQDIQVRANQLWEQAGKPEGQHYDFWRQAERQLNEEKNSPAQNKALLKTYRATMLNARQAGPKRRPS